MASNFTEDFQHPNIAQKLAEILEDLSWKNATKRVFECGHLLKTVLMLLSKYKDDTKIISVIVKILVNLTVPIEYLGVIVKSEVTFNLNKLLLNAKEAFSDRANTKIIMDHMKFLIENGLEKSESCESINNCLVFLRNILHIPGSPDNPNHLQNQIIWNLFTQSIDKVIIYLISCPQNMYFGINLVQLISLLYKDQHVGTLQKLLNLWLETSLSESSEDNESNTSPPHRGDSSPMITSDPTSDSSDSGAAKATKKMLLMTRNKSTETETSSGVSTARNSFDSVDLPRDCQSEDFGYVTQVENQELVSTSSNEEEQFQKPVHQKPFQKRGKSRVVLDKKELRRKKLVKRNKTNSINMKGLLHHSPTDDDIANILKEFTVDFLLKGYNLLVQDLHCQLLSHIHLQIDTSHFFWLITYFLKFATQLELDLEHVSGVLSTDILAYLVFQAIWIYEELEMKGGDLKPSLRRLHLVVTGFREFLQAMEMYQKMIHLSENDRKALEKLQEEIIQMEDLKSLFILLLRRYDPSTQSKQYLQDLIVTNHNFLLFLESATKQNQNFNLMEHLKEFATVEIMRQYGLLLENFRENGEFVNNCIFTMMHHVGGDIGSVATLLQPAILKTFSKIWETDYALCEDWLDLIEYIIHKFVNTPQPDNNDLVDCDWTKEEKDNLLGYYNQSRTCNDTIANITKQYEKDGIKQKTQMSIIRQLFEQNIINERQFDEFKQAYQPLEMKKTKKCEPLEPTYNIGDGIKILRDYLCKDEKVKFVTWLQRLLIDTCHIKLVLANPQKFKNDRGFQKPIIYYFALLNLPIPVIPWTYEQAAILNYQGFVLLLHKLGFYLPIDTGKCFVTIPNFWNAEHTFTLAQQLGAIDTDKLQFDVSIFKIKNYDFKKESKTDLVQMGKFSLSEKFIPDSVRYTPLPCRYYRSQPLSITIPGLEQLPCHLPPPELSIVGHHVECSPNIDENERSETASIESDLTRMCVSDEDDKLVLVIQRK